MHAVYVSYDGAAEPLGMSQVLPYVERLARHAQMTLMTFEKPGSAADAVAARLAGAGVRWVPKRYHGNPPLASSLLDVLSGVRTLRREAAMHTPAVLHARSYVSALIAVAGRRTGVPGRFLFDMRGFWRDERVDAGYWPRGGLVDRVVLRCEERFYAEADAVVTLTHASVPHIRKRLRGRDVPVWVIPTCAEVRRFAGALPRAGGPHAVWSGSIGAHYRFDLAVKLASALELPLTVLTREVTEARRILAGRPALVRTVDPADMPERLHPGDIGLALITRSFSKTASAPTRFAEFLASGMPVVVTPGIGDLEALVENNRVGVTLLGEDDDALSSAARRLRKLAADPALPDRARALARERFDADAGAEAFARLYGKLAALPPSSSADTPVSMD